MIDFSAKALPLICLSLANFLLSWLWYSPLLLAKPWAKALKIDMNKPMTDEQKKGMPLLFANGLLCSVLLVYALNVLVMNVGGIFGAHDFATGAKLGLLAWAGFSLTTSLNTLWEGRPKIVLAINNGLALILYPLFGGILAIWR